MPAVIASWMTVALILAIAAIIMWIAWGIRNPGKWGYAIAPLSWLVNVGVFSGCFVAASSLGRMVPHLFNYWGQVVIIQGLLLTGGVVTVLLFDGRDDIWHRWKKKKV